MLTPMSEQGITGSSRATSTTKLLRVLACVLCQQRKIKCDRSFPCANCRKSHAQCVPAATLPPRRRRRRLPERELLDRLRRYEGLLRQNNIDFEPLHVDPSAIEKQSPNLDGGAEYDSPEDEHPGAAAGPGQSSSPSTIKSESVYKTRYALIIKKIHIMRSLIFLSQESMACDESKGTPSLRLCCLDSTNVIAIVPRLRR